MGTRLQFSTDGLAARTNRTVETLL